MKPASDFGILIGEAFVDLIAQPVDGGLIYVPKFGGSPLNFAVGMRRLSVPVKLASTLAPGGFGSALQDFCIKEDVDITSLSTAVEKSFVAVATPKDGHVSYEYFGEIGSLTEIKPFDLGTARAAKVIHASSTALLADPARATVLETFQKAQGFKSIDPNPRLSLISNPDAYRDELSKIYPSVDLIKGSDEDFEFLVPRLEPEAAALQLHKEYGATVIVTRAELPTIIAFDGEVSSVTVPPTKVLDATGAGDSFMASILSDVVLNGVPSDLVSWHNYMSRANQAAAATCQNPGGAESMPTAARLGR